MTTFARTIRISPDVISQEVPLGETVLMDVRTLVYFGLDELGSAVWQAIRAHPDADQAFAQLRSSNRSPEEQLAQKFRAILDALEKSGLIRLEPIAADH